MSIKKRFEEIHEEMEKIAEKEVEKYNAGKISYGELAERLTVIKEEEIGIIKKAVDELGDL